MAASVKLEDLRPSARCDHAIVAQLPDCAKTTLCCNPSTDGLDTRLRVLLGVTFSPDTILFRKMNNRIALLLQGFMLLLWWVY